MCELGRHTILLDGDNIRHGLNKDLGFTEADRIENIRRVGEVAKLMTDAVLIVIMTFISPYSAEREMVKKLATEGEFFEIYVSTPIEECERLDIKRPDRGRFLTSQVTMHLMNHRKNPH